MPDNVKRKTNVKIDATGAREEKNRLARVKNGRRRVPGERLAEIFERIPKRESTALPFALDLLEKRIIKITDVAVSETLVCDERAEKKSREESRRNDEEKKGFDAKKRKATGATRGGVGSVHRRRRRLERRRLRTSQRPETLKNEIDGAFFVATVDY